MKLLEHKKDHMVIMNDDNKIETLPETSYYLLKTLPEYNIYRNEEGRVTWVFSGVGTATETYDRKIFNIEFMGKRFQLRELQADNLCDLILHNNIEGFLKMSEALYQVEHQRDIIESLLAPYANRLYFEPKGVIIDDNFKIGYEGTAYVIDTEKLKNPKVKKDKWNHLCIVPKGIIRKQKIHTPIGEVELSPIMQTILSKVVFLLNPNMKDKVFTDQLPRDLCKCLIDEFGGKHD